LVEVDQDVGDRTRSAEQLEHSRQRQQEGLIGPRLVSRHEPVERIQLCWLAVPFRELDRARF
jgi:hypothetical protein